MKARSKILALLFTAICLLGILPLSVSAYTPAVEGVKYTYTNPEPDVPFMEDGATPPTTDISASMSYFACEGSPIEGAENSSIDVLSGQITKIGSAQNYDGWYVRIEGSFNVLAYIPPLSPGIISGNISGSITLFSYNIQGESQFFAILDSAMGQMIFYPKTDFIFTLDQVLPTTDMTILNNALKAFSAEITTSNYVDWILNGYNGITDVFVNNAKIQYVIDNPIFIIALVVFAMAIAFAVATFIFKIFRRY